MIIEDKPVKEGDIFYGIKSGRKYTAELSQGAYFELIGDFVEFNENGVPTYWGATADQVTRIKPDTKQEELL